MIILNRLVEFSGDWAFVVGHMAWQAAVVAILLLAVVHFGKRWPAPVRHALLLLALVKFLTPPVTNLPVGVFSCWNVAPTTATQPAVVEKPEVELVDTVAYINASSTSDDVLTSSAGARESLVAQHDSQSIPPEVEDAVPSLSMRQLIGEVRPATAEAETVATAANENVGTSIDRQQADSPVAPRIDFPPTALLLMLIHFCGAGVFLTYLVWKVRRVRKLVDGLPHAPANLQRQLAGLAEQIGQRRLVSLRVTEEDCSPYSFGVSRPSIVVSRKQVNELSDEQMKAVLLHELVHHHRRDLLVCWWQAIVTTLWWFHPVVWLLNRQIRNLREDCCDDFLLSRQHVDAEFYCTTLLKVADGLSRRSGRPLPMTVSMADSHPLSDRFRRIMDEGQVRRGSLTVAGVVCILIAAVVLLPGLSNGSQQVDDEIKYSTAQPVDEKLPARGAAENSGTRPASPEVTVTSTVGVPATAKISPDVAASDKPMAKWPDSILVRCLHPDGKPIVGANVLHNVDRTTIRYTTAANGEISVPMPRNKAAVEFMSLIVDAEPYVVFGKFWYPQRTPNRSIAAEYEFKLETGQSVGGRVTDADGMPVPNVKVHVTGSPNNGKRQPPRPSAHEFTATTDNDGRWVQGRLPTDLSDVQMQCRHAEFISDPNKTWERDESVQSLIKHEHHKVLKKGTLLTGRITDSDGKPVKGARLRMGSDFSLAHADIPTTDADGRFRFPHCSKGRDAVTAVKDGWAPSMQFARIGNDPLHLELRMQPAKTVTVKVVDANGAPVAGVSVMPDTWREVRTLHFVRQHFGYDYPKTDANGLWVWKSAPADEVMYNTYKPGWRRIYKVAVTASDDVYQLTMAREVVVSATAVDAATGKAISNYRYTPGSGSSLHDHRAKDGKDGAFQITFDDAGENLRLRVEAQGYEQMTLPVEPASDGTVALNFRLEAAAGPRYVVVKKPDGTPERNARIILATKQNRAYIRSTLRSDGNRGTTLMTDETGKLELPGLTEDFSVFAVSDPGPGGSRTRIASQLVTNSPPHSGDVRLTTTPTARVEGIVRKGRKPLADELVSLQLIDNFGGPFTHFDLDAQTDANGRFVFEHVPAGEPVTVYHTLVERDRQFRVEHRGASARLTPVPGQVVSLELVQGDKYSVRGTFAFDDGKGTAVDWAKYSATLFQISPDEKKSAEIPRYAPSSVVVLAADGSFDVDGLTEGRYRLCFSAFAGQRRGEPRHPTFNGSTRTSFTFPADDGGVVLDVGTLTVYPDGKESPPAPKNVFSGLIPAGKKMPVRPPSGVFELHAIVKNAAGKTIPGAKVTVWSGDTGPTEKVSKDTDAAGLAAFDRIPTHGGWLFVEADGFRFHGQAIDPAKPGSVMMTPVVPLSVTAAAVPWQPRSHATSSQTLATVHKNLAEFSERVMAQKVQRIRFELTRFLPRFMPKLAIRISDENTIDFGSMNDDPEHFANWHDTVIRIFAAQTLCKTDAAAAEAVLETIRILPSRCRGYCSAAANLPAAERARALKWLNLAEELAREAGDENIPPAYRLGMIGAGYRQLHAEDDALRVLKEAADEAVQAKPGSDFYDASKGMIARQLAPLDLPAALKLIDIDFNAQPESLVDQGDLEERIQNAANDLRKGLVGTLLTIKAKDDWIAGVAVAIADVQPKIAEQLLARMRMGWDHHAAKIIHRMAEVDFVRARRIAEQTTDASYRGQAFGALADAVVASDNDQARRLIRQAFQILASAEAPANSRGASPLKVAVSLLPTVEKIDTTLVREFVFRTLALRQTTTCGGNVPINYLGRSAKSQALRLSDPVLAAAIARYDSDIAHKLAMAPGDTTLDLDFDAAPYFLLGVIAQLDSIAAVDAVNKLPEDGHDQRVNKMTAWKQVLPALMLDRDAYWTWLMKDQFGVWEVGSAD